VTTAGSSVTANGSDGGNIVIDADGTAIVAGTVEAKGESGAGGTIVLKAAGDLMLDAGSRVDVSGANGGTVSAVAGGTTIVAGTVDASGTSGTGGRVEVLGDLTGIFDGARVYASGATGGGTILIGGDFQGAAISSGGHSSNLCEVLPIIRSFDFESLAINFQTCFPIQHHAVALQTTSEIKQLNRKRESSNSSSKSRESGIEGIGKCIMRPQSSSCWRHNFYGAGTIAISRCYLANLTGYFYQLDIIP